MPQGSPPLVPVTVETFVRAETDRYFGGIVRQEGFGAFEHHRAPAAIEAQSVVRMNRDTLYSGAVLDLDAGAATVTLPDAGRRFLSLQVIDQDEYTPAVHYGAGRHTLTREQVGTRYVALAVRILVDPADPADVAAVHALQDALTIAQPGGPGRFEVPAWDPASQTAVRDALLALGATLPDSRGMFGPRGGVDPVRHLIGAAVGWGGTRTRRPSTSPSPRPATTAPPPTASPCGTSPWTASGRSASTTPRATSSPTPPAPTRSTT